MKELKSLCDTCEHRTRVEAREVGLQLDHCRVTNLNIDKLGVVSKCTRYVALDAPYLFVQNSAVLNLDGSGNVWWTSYSSHRIIRGKKPKDDGDAPRFVKASELL